MEINEATIDKLASLARLKFNETEKVQIRIDLQNMISLVEKMNELDTENIEPLLHMSSNVNTMREDIVQGSIANKDALQNAKKHKEPYFIVPTVIKK